MADLLPAIEKAAAQPKSATSDGLAVVQQPIADQIAADRYGAAKRARATVHRGVMFNKLIPAAAMPDSQTERIGGAGNFATGGGVV